MQCAFITLPSRLLIIFQQLVVEALNQLILQCLFGGVHVCEEFDGTWHRDRKMKEY